MTSSAKPIYLDSPTFTRETALELKDIKALIDLMTENDLSVFEMEKEGFKIKLQKDGTPGAAPIMAGPIAPQPAAAAMPQAQTPVSEAAAASLNEIVSPMVGTFYRASSPDSSPFVDIGTRVTEDTVVCIIEAMKVMNEIKAETSGVIAEVVAENGKPVQFGQALFRVR